MRADLMLVERGLFESRSKAQAAIAAGLVTADGKAIAKPSAEVPADAVLQARAPHPFVSRGGVKLAAALDHFDFDPSGHVCLDVGASTGGFTDVLLARRARHVYAIDVGRDQLHARLRALHEVTSMESTDIRDLSATALPEPPTFAVIDVSFISLRLILPAVHRLLQGPATLVALIKPQFEAGRSRVKKGVVRDPAIHAAVCDEITTMVVELGWTVTGLLPSPIAGGNGNREFLLGATRQ
ncbi:MAG: rRNA (cytidine1920-2-O)/16S rRNA (cytidine1409-2-O)-methyltransferase [Gammaproteobacteria bacterium]|nr:rRNA (cytidine1920-2-O)/16S rRNA (cytidine1409-2-O)-methyltransferase [Gammaproteobacteria bacterium]